MNILSYLFDFLICNFIFNTRTTFRCRLKKLMYCYLWSYCLYISCYFVILLSLLWKFLRFPLPPLFRGIYDGGISSFLFSIVRTKMMKCLWPIETFGAINSFHILMKMKQFTRLSSSRCLVDSNKHLYSNSIISILAKVRFISATFVSINSFSWTKKIDSKELFVSWNISRDD